MNPLTASLESAVCNFVRQHLEEQSITVTQPIKFTISMSGKDVFLEPHERPKYNEIKERLVISIIGRNPRFARRLSNRFKPAVGPVDPRPYYEILEHLSYNEICCIMDRIDVFLLAKFFWDRSRFTFNWMEEALHQIETPEPA